MDPPDTLNGSHLKTRYLSSYYNETYFLNTDGRLLPGVFRTVNDARVEARNMIRSGKADNIILSAGARALFVIYRCPYHGQIEAISLKSGLKYLVDEDGSLLLMSENDALACDAKKKKSRFMGLFSRKKRNQIDKQIHGQSQLVTVFYEDGSKETFISDFPMVVAIAHANNGGHTSFTITDSRFEKRGVKQTLYKDKKGNWKDENGKFVLKISH